MSTISIPTPDAKDWALYYASTFNWKVIPLHRPTGPEQCSCGKPGCNGSSGKHPNCGTDWQNKATSDSAQIETWWQANPHSNLGVRLGPASGIVDVEYDDQLGHQTAIRLGLDKIATPTYVSNRSTHRLFQSPSQTLSTKAVEKRDGLEIRLGTSEKGTQSVFPPSIHHTGVMYQWVSGLSPQDVAVAELPQCIVDLINVDTRKSAGSTFQVEHTIETHPGEAEGNRHPVFIKLIGSWLAQNGMEDFAPLYQHALAWNQRCSPPKDESYVHDTVNDMVQREAAKNSQPTTDYRETPPTSFEPFPIDSLPHPLVEIVRTAAHVIDCDPSFVALPILSVLSAVIGNSRKLHINQTWEVPPLIWSAIVGDSGTRKSPGFDFALRPIDSLERSFVTSYEGEMEAYALARLSYEKELSAWRRNTESSAIPPQEPQEPTLPEIKTDDCTIEAVADVLSRNPNGILVSSDELAGWLASMDRYNNGGGDRARWLSMFNARSLKLNRKTGVKHVRIDNAAVAITGGIQSEILRQQFSGEAVSSGLAARFIMAWPPERTRRWERRVMPVELVQQYFDLVTQLNAQSQSPPVKLTISDEVEQIYGDYFNIHNRQKIDTFGGLKAAWNKLEELPLRLALIFESITEPTATTISVASIEKAINIAEWTKQEASRIYDMLGSPKEEFQHLRLVEWIKLRGRATVRDVRSNLRTYRSKSVSEVEAILQTFCSRQVEGKKVFFVPQ